MSSRISDLTPAGQTLCRAVIAEFTKEDIPVVVVSTLRTLADQQAEWFKGRDSKGNIVDKSAVVTYCDGIINKSNHQSGNAFDITFADAHGNPYWPDQDTSDGSTRWLSFAAIVERCGGRSGARFAPINQWGCGFDPDHVEVPV